MLEEKLSYKEAAREFDVSSDTVVAKWERIYLEEGADGLRIERRGRKSTGRPAKLKKDVEEDLIAEVQRLRADEKMRELFSQVREISEKGDIMGFEEIQKKAETAETLDELFDLWKLAHKAEGKTYTKPTTPARGKHPAIEQTSFVRDAYVSGNLCDYENANRKVLFILKEANILAYRGDSVPEERDQLPFYCDYLEDGKSNRAKQQEKMARMAYYLQHPDLDEESRRMPTLKDCQLALRQSAFMNLNKRGGDNHAKVVSAYSKKYAAFIERQIDLLAPDVIVVIGRTGYPMREGCIHVWHTAYSMPWMERLKHPVYCDTGDQNVDLYMRRFFEVCGEMGE